MAINWQADRNTPNTVWTNFLSVLSMFVKPLQRFYCKSCLSLTPRAGLLFYARYRSLRPAIASDLRSCQTLQPIHTSNIVHQKKRRCSHPLCSPTPLSPGRTAGNCDLTFSTVPSAFPPFSGADMPQTVAGRFLERVGRSAEGRKSYFFCALS